jgi:hypothetical protein
MVVDGHLDEADRRLRAFARADLALQPEDSGPYRDARYHLTSWIVEMAQGPFGPVDRDESLPRQVGVARCEAPARLIAGAVATLYPSLRERLMEPARLRAIAEAIWASRKKKSWQAIVACWEGIEAGENAPETWRTSYERWAADRGRP